MTKILRLLAALISLTLFWAIASAQSGQSTLTGTVMDTSGAAIPGADVTATEVETGVSTRTASNSLGYYTFPSLQPGNYKVQIRKEGFQELIRYSVTLIVGQTTSADAKLEVGRLTQTIVVSSVTPLLQTQDASLGGFADERQILNMPLNGRDPYQLVALLPGVQPQGISEPRIFAPSVNESNFTTNGSPPLTNDSLVDGIPNMVGLHGQMAWTPSVDAVQEFRVLTSTYPAEYGRTGGGIISLATKSGTNQFHGRAFEFLRNTVFDANDYFNNQSGVPRGPLVFNMFGATIGGPIRRNRSFFFFSYEGQTLREGVTFLGTVPTAAQRLGDFSQTYDSAGKLITIYDPATSVLVKGTTYTRTAFPGNMIPSNRMDQAALGVMAYYPLPNLPGQGPSGVDNYISVSSLKNAYRTWDARIDQNFSNQDSLFVRFSWDNQTSVPANAYNNIATSNSTGPYTSPDYNAGIAETHTFGPKTLLELRAGFARDAQNRKSESNGMDLTTLGFPASLNSIAQNRQFPNFIIASMSDIGASPAADYVLGSNVLFFSGMVTRTEGHHNLQIGGEFRDYQINDFTGSDTSPAFAFTSAFTQGPDSLTSALNSGSGFASFLLGAANSGTLKIAPILNVVYRTYAAFIQDDYRATPRFTLNLGFRYDFQAPRLEHANRANWFDFNVPSPIGPQVGLPGLQGGLEFAGVNGNSRYMWNPSYGNVGPRIGFAYQIKPKTVLRGGFGILYLPGGTQSFLTTGSDFGFSSSTSMVTTINGATPVNTLSDPFPQGQVPTTGNSAGLLTGLGQTLQVLPRNVPRSYMEMYNLNIQQQLPAEILLQVGYVGTHGVHITRDDSWDQLPDQDLSMGGSLLTLVTNPFYGYVTTGVYSEPTIQQGYLLRPYPQFAAVQATWGGGNNRGGSTYDSLQISVDRRFASGFDIFGSYTSSKFFTDSHNNGVNDAPIQDYNNLAAEHSLSTEDIPQRLVINFIYELPIGRGKRWFGNSGALADRLIGGWRVSGITTLQSGFPLPLTTSVNNTHSFGGGSRPNSNGQSAKLSGSQRTIAQWFNTSVFSQPALYTFGNVQPTLANVRTDGTHNLDVSVVKTTTVVGTVKLEFHADAFNIFNTPQFAIPGTTYGDSDFGVVSAMQNDPRELQFGLKLFF